MVDFVGKLTTLAEHQATYQRVVRHPISSVRLWPKCQPVDDVLSSCDLQDVLVTSHFLPVDLAKHMMFLDQSYSGVIRNFPLRFQVVGDGYHLGSDPISSPGRHIVIGGPIDRVWYHWLFNWCPRVLLAQWLRPDLFRDPTVRFVIHPYALEKPFVDILDTFGLAASRFLVVDPTRDYRLERATLVSFPDQNRLYPGLIERFRRHCLAAFRVNGKGAPTRLFASRQSLPAPKRRIANFEELAPVLERAGIVSVSLGDVDAIEQVRLFHNAEIIVGAHGSDLANLLFCRPGTPVVVIESRFSVENRLHVGLRELARILGLEYRLYVTDTIDDGEQLAAGQRTARDYLVDAERFEAFLQSVPTRVPVERRLEA